eukprot:TCALIF_02593-PA protein Name:"Protein of unknown function" AED:0.21 eAED:0.21 QI:0/0.33/0.25/0.5/0.66/0.5/4/174/316
MTRKSVGHQFGGRVECVFFVSASSVFGPPSIGLRGISTVSSSSIETHGGLLNHDLNGSCSLSSSANSTPPLPTSATPPDWIELSTSLSKDLKRDLLSKGIKKKIVSATSDLIIKQDDSVQPLLPKEDLATPSISSTTPTTSTTTSPSHTLLSSQNKGRAPQPPTPSLQQHSNFHRVPSNSDVIVNQPIRSSSISRGLQVENEDLIQFSNTCHNTRQLSHQGPPINQPLSTMNNNNIEKLDKKRIPSTDLFDTEDLENNLDYKDEDFYEDLDGTDSLSSVRTTEERMEYLESLEKCPCYAKCCIDSIITLFCVTLLG